MNHTQQSHSMSNSSWLITMFHPSLVQLYFVGTSHLRWSSDLHKPHSAISVLSNSPALRYARYEAQCSGPFPIGDSALWSLAKQTFPRWSSTKESILNSISGTLSDYWLDAFEILTSSFRFVFGLLSSSCLTSPFRFVWALLFLLPIDGWPFRLFDAQILIVRLFEISIALRKLLTSNYNQVLVKND